MIASVKTIRRHFGDKVDAKALRVLLEKLSLRKDLETTRRDISDMLGGHGWEPLYWSHLRISKGYSIALWYLNMGSPYETTILLYPSGTVRVGCWGDVVEAYR